MSGLPCRGTVFAVAAAAVIIYAVYMQRYQHQELVKHPRGPRAQRPLKAVIVGATGATGRRVVELVLASPHWTGVTVVVRRPTGRKGAPVKYQEIVVPDLSTVEAKIFEGHDVLFNCLGTTRAGGHVPKEGDVGGAENFVNVEVTMTKAVSQAAVRAGIHFASVVTAEGANHNFLKGHDWIKYVHPLLYMRTLGQKEQETIAAGFERVSIFRPGLLNREVGNGMFQRLQDHFNLGLPVSILAEAMVRDAEAAGPAPLVIIESNSRIKQSSKL